MLGAPNRQVKERRWLSFAELILETMGGPIGSWSWPHVRRMIGATKTPPNSTLNVTQGRDYNFAQKALTSCSSSASVGLVS